MSYLVVMIKYMQLIFVWHVTYRPTANKKVFMEIKRGKVTKINIANCGIVRVSVHKYSKWKVTWYPLQKMWSSCYHRYTYDMHAKNIEDTSDNPPSSQQDFQWKQQYIIWCLLLFNVWAGIDKNNLSTAPDWDVWGPQAKIVDGPQ